ncbi:hypothetical protein KFD70_19710 [Bacillus pfraonensis]|uniref:hypothetical protein n=1 Tax=Bacillus pfraonensis TaxID=2830844 RepID=UPI002A558574|nr:hypothetical protein [Bacillus pseudomycoides]
MKVVTGCLLVLSLYFYSISFQSVSEWNFWIIGLCTILIYFIENERKENIIHTILWSVAVGFPLGTLANKWLPFPSSLISDWEISGFPITSQICWGITLSIVVGMITRTNTFRHPIRRGAWLGVIGGSAFSLLLAMLLYTYFDFFRSIYVIPVMAIVLFHSYTQFTAHAVRDIGFGILTSSILYYSSYHLEWIPEVIKPVYGEFIMYFSFALLVVLAFSWWSARNSTAKSYAGGGIASLGSTYNHGSTSSSPNFSFANDGDYRNHSNYDTEDDFYDDTNHYHSQSNSYSRYDDEEDDHSNWGMKQWEIDKRNEEEFSGYPDWYRQKEIEERESGLPWYARSECPTCGNSPCSCD